LPACATSRPACALPAPDGSTFNEKADPRVGFFVSAVLALQIDGQQKTRWVSSGFLLGKPEPNYFSLISLYSTCLRAFGSNFMIDIFSGIVFLFLLVV
jgi:hypothetical protein